MLTYLMYFLWLPLEAGLTRSMFRFSFKRGRNLSFLIYPLVLMRWSPKEIIQHQALLRTVFLRLLRLRRCGFVYVYISQYTVMRNQNRFF